MPKAMTTVGEGPTSFIAVPTWSAASATEATGGYYIRLKFSVPSLAAVNHLFGSSASSAGSVRTLTDGSLRYRNNSLDLITSPTGLVVPNQIHEMWLVRQYSPVAGIEMLLDGTSVGTTSTTTLGFLTNVNQLARFSNTARSDITVYEFEVYNGAASYIAAWMPAGAAGSGVNWADTLGSRNLTMTNPTVLDDSWWVDYGAAGATMAASLFSLSSVSSALEANIQLMSTLASVSYISSALTAGATGLAASLQTRSSAAAQATTQVHMADVLSATATATPSLSSQVRFGAQLAGVTSMTASIDVPAGNGNIAATLSTRSSLYATLLEQIQLATLAKSSATLTATIAGSAARMAAQLKNKSAVYSSFQAYKQVSFDVIGIPDGSYHTFVRDHITHQVLYDADAVYSAQQLTLYVNAQSGDKVSGYVIDRSNPAENGAVLYGLVS